MVLCEPTRMEIDCPRNASEHHQDSIPYALVQTHYKFLLILDIRDCYDPEPCLKVAIMFRVLCRFQAFIFRLFFRQRTRMHFKLYHINIINGSSFLSTKNISALGSAVLVTQNQARPAVLLPFFRLAITLDNRAYNFH